METKLEMNKQVPFSSGWTWIKQSFEVFKVIPIQALVLSLIIRVLMLVPLINGVMQPFLVARFAEMSHRVTKGDDYKFSEMFKGLFNNRTLVQLAMMNLLFFVVIDILTVIISGYYDNKFLSILIAIILHFILRIFMWLAPLICCFNPSIEPRAAMILSFKASMHNVITLLLFGIIVCGFTILAILPGLLSIQIFGFNVLTILPIGLGLLVWCPIFDLSTYFMYKGIYNTNL